MDENDYMKISVKVKYLYNWIHSKYHYILIYFVICKYFSLIIC